MITGLKFPNLSEDEMVDLSRNTIVLFNNTELLYKFGKCMSSLIGNLDTDEIDYELLDNEEDLNIRNIIAYRANHLYVIKDKCDNQQKIMFTVEPTAILTITDKYDLWFVDSNNENKIQIYALTDFKGYGSDGLSDYTSEDIYKKVCCGIFGCYEGYTGK